MNDLTVNGDVSGSSISCNNLVCDSINGNIYVNTARSSGDVTGNIGGDFNGNINGSLNGKLNQYNGEDLMFSGNKITFTYNGETYTGYVFGQ